MRGYDFAMANAPLVLVNAVGMTSKLLSHAPAMARLAQSGWVRSLEEVLPAVTSTAQATLLTGALPERHGIVANGWLFRDTMEVRFWQQSNRLLEAEPIYRTVATTSRLAGRSFKCAKLFWWFNQGADVTVSVTPKPHYGADGNKAFDIAGAPADLLVDLKATLGPFPFPSFWGPNAGGPSTRWIADAAAKTLDRERPDLTFVYLPHLDYDPQRFGPSGCDMAKQTAFLDDCVDAIVRSARAIGARVWIVSEYGHCDVDMPIFPNRELRRAGLLEVRDGPFGESLDTFASRAFAVCDHQLCHVYVRDTSDIAGVANQLAKLGGVAGVHVGDERSRIGLAHPRSGEIVLHSEPRAWFAYPYWLDDRRAPDFARTVDIHRKPGFDPCEMFFDPQLRHPKLRAARRLLQKKLGFRALFDVIGLDAHMVRGSHGLRAVDPLDRPILIGDGSPPANNLKMTDVQKLLPIGD